MDKKKLFVGGLPWSMSRASLEELFIQFGEIVETIIISDRDTGRSKGFGFITFVDEDNAVKAQKEMNGKDIEDRNINVNFAKPKEERSRPFQTFRRNQRMF